MRIVIATDAWHPQVNGVVRSLDATVERLGRRGHEVTVVEPGLFRSFPCPTYPEIRLALGCAGKVERMLDGCRPDALHVATEGPIGWAVRRWCRLRKQRFTSSFHTRFPDYVSLRTGLPPGAIWPVIRRFHQAAERVMGVTPSLLAELGARGLNNTHHWPLGTDLSLFHPGQPRHPLIVSLARPVLLYVGRVAVEKNIAAFLRAPVPGTRVVVGDGPALASLRRDYPDVQFLGARHAAELASIYASADALVFPSRTDTFGLVNIEALACGLPVAAFPERGPLDILGHDGAGVHGGTRRIGAVDPDLSQAIRLALSANREAAVEEARHYDWERCTDRFLTGLVPARATGGALLDSSSGATSREPVSA